MLEDVKTLLGIIGDYQDAVVQAYIDEVIAFMVDSGVHQDKITPGIVARGVSDLWDLGAGSGKLSDYFIKRTTQLACRG